MENVSVKTAGPEDDAIVLLMFQSVALKVE